MKKLLSVLAILSLVFSPVTPAFAAPIDVADGANITWTAATNTPNYTGTDATGIFRTTNNGQDIAGVTIVNAGSIGTLSIYGTTTITGNIGDGDSSLAVLNVQTQSDSPHHTILQGNAYVTETNFASTYAWLEIDGDYNYTGAIEAVGGTDGRGYLELNGTSTITGQVGTDATHRLIRIQAGADGETDTFNGAVYSQALNITGAGEVQLDAASTITTTTFNGAGTLDLNGDLTGDIGFNDNGTVTLQGGYDINGEIGSSTGPGVGTLTFAAGGDSTITGAVGSGNSLATVNIESAIGETATFVNTTDATTIALSGAGKAQFDDTVTATSLNITSAGEVELNSTCAITTTTFTGAGTLDINVDLTGDIAMNAAGTITLADNRTISGPITVNANNQGTLTIEGTSTFASAIGTSSVLDLATINAGADGELVIFNGAVYANAFNVTGTGEVDLNAASTVGVITVGTTGTLGVNADLAGDISIEAGGAVEFDSGGDLTGDIDIYDAGSSITLEDGSDINGTIIVHDNNIGTLTVNGESNIGDIGTDNTHDLATITVANAAVGYLNGSVYANALTINGTGTAVIDQNSEIAATIVAGAGTLTAYGDITGNITIATTGTVGFDSGGDLFGNIAMNGDGSIVLGDGSDINGSITSDANNQGDLTIGGTSNISGDVADAGHILSLITIEDSASAQFNAVYTQTLTLGQDATALITGDAWTSSISIGSNSTLTLSDATFDVDDVVVMNGDATLTIQGSATFNGSIEDDGLAILNVDADITAGFVDVGTINITGSSSFDGDITVTELNYSADTTAEIADGHNITGAIEAVGATDGRGTLTLNGTTTVSGQVGTDATHRLKQINAGAAGEIATFSSDVYAITTTVTGTGTVNLNGSLTGTTLNYTAGGTVNLATGENINAAVTTSADGQGTLSFAGTHTLGGDVGVVGGNALFDVNVNGGTVSTGYDIAATTIDIANNATLRLTGDIATEGTLATAAAASSAVNLQGYTLTHTGNMTFGADSDLYLDVASATSFGNATISGTLTLPATVDITVNVINSSIAGGTALTVIDGSAGAGVAGGNTVTDNSFLLSFTATTDAANQDLILNVIRTQTLNTLSGEDSNTAAVGTALEGARATATGDMLNVLTILDNMSSAQEITDSLETMHPDVSSGAMQGARSLNAHFLTAISNRLAFARSGFASGSGVSSGNLFQGAGFWMQGLGSYEKQNTREGIQGYDANTFGTSIGFDKLLGKHFRAGLAAGYGFGDINSKTPGSPSAGLNSWQATLYGSYDSVNLCEARKQRKYSRTAVRNQAERLWYVDGMLAFTQNNYDSRREIFLGAEKRVAKADNHAQQYSTKFETGYTFLFEKTRDLEITPFASLAYNFLYMNKYKEDGANALNLSVDGKGYNQLEQGLGLKFAYPFMSEKYGTFIPSIKGAWLFDYLADRFETTASFAGGGPAFSTYGVKPARNAFLLGTELAFLNRKNMTLTGNFDWILRDQYASYTYYLTLRFDF